MERKGEEPVILDVSEVSGIADYFVLVTGSSAPHLKALYQAVHTGLKQHDIACFRHSGEPDSGWMVLDYVDVVVHLLTAEQRAYYSLEDYWSQAPRVS